MISNAFQQPFRAFGGVVNRASSSFAKRKDSVQMPQTGPNSGGEHAQLPVVEEDEKVELGDVDHDHGRTLSISAQGEVGQSSIRIQGEHQVREEGGAALFPTVH